MVRLVNWMRGAGRWRYALAAALFLFGVGLALGLRGQDPDPPPPVAAGERDTAVDWSLMDQPGRPVRSAPAPAPEPDPCPRFSEPELPGAVSVIVNNVPADWPQAGLDRADLVFEFEMEGGSTRLLALFHSLGAEKIGPVRSARLYFVKIVAAYNAPFFHAGGNLDALAAIPRLGIPDLDDIYNAGGYGWRSSDRKPPHNLYINTDLMLKASTVRNYELTPLRFSLIAPEGQTGDSARAQEGPWRESAAATRIGLQYANLPSFRYHTEYVYENDRYVKHVNGQPVAMEDGALIHTDHVVVLRADAKLAKPPGEWDWQLDIEVPGQGDAYFFSGGRMLQGSWRKQGPYTDFEFTVTVGDEDVPVVLPPGVVWVNHITDHKQLQVDTGDR